MSTTEQGVISQMFDGIADTYDTTNRILSFGQDIAWRAQMAHFLPAEGDIALLDVATGTADVLITLCTQCPRVKQAVGIDVADNMLNIARQKLAKRGFLQNITLHNADASALPFANHSFDVVSIAFGIRNVAAHDDALSEFARVLKPQGRLIILEFSMPSHGLVKKLYQFYFRHILPRLGGWLSSNPQAYRYLNSSVEAFPHPSQYRQMLLSKGFSVVELKTLSFGVATIYCARKI